MGTHARVIGDAVLHAAELPAGHGRREADEEPVVVGEVRQLLRAGGRAGGGVSDAGTPSFFFFFFFFVAHLAAGQLVAEGEGLFRHNALHCGLARLLLRV